MKVKLLFIFILGLFLSSCFTRLGYVYTDECVDDVYIYGVNHIYTNLWYDDFYWEHSYNFGLFFSPIRYYRYPYYHHYKPYYFSRPNFEERHSTKRNTYNFPRQTKKRENIIHNKPLKRNDYNKFQRQIKKKENPSLKPKSQNNTKNNYNSRKQTIIHKKNKPRKNKN